MKESRNQILAENLLADFLRGQNIVLHGSGDTLTTNRCPLGDHKNGHRPVTITPSKGLWHCNDHGKGGSLIDWRALAENRTVADVLKELGGGNGTHAAPIRKPSPAHAEPQTAQDFSARWRECVAAFSDSHAAKLADWRGYSAEFCAWLKAQGIVGILAADTYGNKECWAFPIRDKDGRVVGVHYRTGKESPPWLVEGGCKMRPLIVGDLKAASAVIVGESQWDIFTAMNLLPQHGNSFAFVATRGASNGKAIAGLCRPDVTIYTLPQNDDAGRKWLADVAAHAGATVKAVATPAPHKDLNDWTRAGATLAELDAAINAAKIFEPPKKEGELPAMADAAAFCAVEIPTPPEIIGGILHKGCKLVIGGSSKARKSWALLDMALSVSAGARWLNFSTTKARVLFVNLELPPFSIQHRLQSIARARGLEIAPDTLTLWNLRGHAAPYQTLLPQITAQAIGKDFGLVILDPSYKLLGDADENSAADIALLLNALERLAIETGAAVAFTAHFAKGNAAGKEAQDRISGSGVFARDPDAILVCTALQTPDCYAVESILRTLPPQKPFAIRWQFPAFQVADDLNPADLKQAQRTVKPTPTPEQVLALFKTDTANPRAALLTATQMQQLFRQRGWEKESASALRDQLDGDGKLKVVSGAHGAKLAGLPDVVDAYQKQLAESGTVLEQAALPAVQKPKRQRRKK